ncbi:MAG: hypothetical protein H0T89_29520 [Deltaproteobacteria bacterium]|nr:hypothetical protein [Deltaproteobacteria bacterium]MDQ3301043.1 hypothetical protein [Myxococcota bacterium]
MSFLALMAIAIAVAWWWISRVRVSPAPIAMMPTRIAFPGGLRLGDPVKALALLEKPDEIVIPFQHAVLVIDYPLTNPAQVAITAPLSQGFTRRELVTAICEEYENVYEAEEGTAHTKTVPPDERGELPARNRTDGVYGIWGHDLGDLVLSSLRWTRRADGVVEIELHVQR